MNRSDAPNTEPITDGATNRLSSALLAHPTRALVLTALVAAAIAASLTIALTSTHAAPAASGLRGSAGHGATSRTGDPAASLSMAAGAAMGRAFQGRAPEYEPLAAVEAQADQPPAQATVDRNTNTIRFHGLDDRFTIVANPPNGRDMAFRSAGLENPTIEVALGATIQIHFVNGDNDSAHGWLLIDPVVTVGNSPHGPRAFLGSFAPILGDPTSAGQAAETITFQATRAGTYRYECPVPGHAAMGMQGTLQVAT